MKLQLTVPTMVCDGCVDNIARAIKSIDSEAQVNIDLDSKTVTVETAKSKPQVESAITEAGHEIS